MKDYVAFEEKYYDSLPELLSKCAAKYRSKEAASIVDGISYTYEELDSLTTKIASELYGAGLEKGNRVAIISENNPHWVASYFAIMRAGGVVIPILTDFSRNETKSILSHSEAKIVFVSSKQFSKIRDILPEGIKYVVTIEDLKFHPVTDIASIREQDYQNFVKLEKKLPGRTFEKLTPDELAVIIYTSGTTGNSKGVMLTHDNLIFDAVNTGSIHRVVKEDVFLSVLPLAHTYESTIGMIIPLFNGATIHYIDKPPTASYLGPVLKKIRPTTMLTVPLIIEKVYRNSVKQKLSASPVTRFLTKFGPTRKVLHRAAGKKLIDFFGGRIRFFGVGGAALAPEVEKFLIEAKFPYAVGYGLTETSPMLAGFGPDDAVYKSVGRSIAGIDLKILDPDPETGEGEIVAKGRNIMKGYYKNEEMTAEVFTEDGYFKTGDLGIVDKNGIFYIKGRSKNMILGANGENIYPEEIESVINEQEFVLDSLVMQAKGKLTALIHLNYEKLEETIKSIKDSAHDKQVEIQEKAEELISELKAKVNQQLNKNSRIQKTVIQREPFEKTPTQKIKRFKYKD